MSLILLGKFVILSMMRPQVDVQKAMIGRVDSIYGEIMTNRSIMYTIYRRICC